MVLCTFLPNLKQKYLKSLELDLIGKVNGT